MGADPSPRKQHSLEGLHPAAALSWLNAPKGITLQEGLSSAIPTQWVPACTWAAPFSRLPPEYWYPEAGL